VPEQCQSQSPSVLVTLHWSGVYELVQELV
jgi:hypothetical protein